MCEEFSYFAMIKRASKICGFLNVNKPPGITSHGVVSRVRDLFPKGSLKVGHTGTLDPLATGVLLLCLGDATKLAPFFIRKDKSYQGLMKFGVSTDTFDSMGKVTNERPVSFTEEDLDAAMSKYRGKIKQKIPVFSAARMGGERLYAKARRGEQVKILPEKEIEIKRLEKKLLDLSPDKNEAVLDVKCTSGTYIRALMNDIGEDLGCGAHMTGLIRSSVGDFLLKDAVELDSLKGAKQIEKSFVSVEDAFAETPKAVLSPLEAKQMRNKGKVELHEDFARVAEPYVRIYCTTGDFVGVGSVAVKRNHCSITKICFPK